MWRVDGSVIEITSLFTLFNRLKVVIKQYTYLITYLLTELSPS
jgi:hypothetical protein